MRLYIRLVAYLFVIMGFSGAFSGSYVDYVRAIEVDNADTIAALLAKGFDPLAMRDDAPKVDALAPNRNTPLMMAARYGAEDNVKRLLQRGANKQLLNDRKKSAAELRTLPNGHGSCRCGNDRPFATTQLSARFRQAP